MFGLGGEWDIMQQGDSNKDTKSRHDVVEMIKRSRFDPTTGAWLYFISDGRDASRRAATEQRLQDEAVEYIVRPIINVLIKRGWPVAALSRWTGVTSVLKRVILGASMNNCLPNVLSFLSIDMALSEEELKKERAKVAERVLRGEDANDHWLQAASRVTRVSSYFSDPIVAWRLGVLLISGAPLEDLHWRICGLNQEGCEEGRMV